MLEVTHLSILPWVLMSACHSLCPKYGEYLQRQTFDFMLFNVEFLAYSWTLVSWTLISQIAFIYRGELKSQPLFLYEFALISQILDISKFFFLLYPSLSCKVCLYMLMYCLISTVTVTNVPIYTKLGKQMNQKSTHFEMNNKIGQLKRCSNLSHFVDWCS